MKSVVLVKNQTGYWGWEGNPICSCIMAEYERRVVVDVTQALRDAKVYRFSRVSAINSFDIERGTVEHKKIIERLAKQLGVKVIIHTTSGELGRT